MFCVHFPERGFIHYVGFCYRQLALWRLHALFVTSAGSQQPFGSSKAPLPNVSVPSSMIILRTAVEAGYPSMWMNGLDMDPIGFENWLKSVCLWLSSNDSVRRNIAIAVLGRCQRRHHGLILRVLERFEKRMVPQSPSAMKSPQISPAVSKPKPHRRRASSGVLQMLGLSRTNSGASQHIGSDAEDELSTGIDLLKLSLAHVHSLLSLRVRERFCPSVRAGRNSLVAPISKLVLEKLVSFLDRACAASPPNLNGLLASMSGDSATESNAVESVSVVEWQRRAAICVLVRSVALQSTASTNSTTDSLGETKELNEDVPVAIQSCFDIGSGVRASLFSTLLKWRGQLLSTHEQSTPLIGLPAQQKWELLDDDESWATHAKAKVVTPDKDIPRGRAGTLSLSQRVSFACGVTLVELLDFALCSLAITGPVSSPFTPDAEMKESFPWIQHMLMLSLPEKVGPSPILHGWANDFSGMVTEVDPAWPEGPAPSTSFRLALLSLSALCSRDASFVHKLVGCAYNASCDGETQRRDALSDLYFSALVSLVSQSSTILRSPTALLPVLALALVRLRAPDFHTRSRSVSLLSAIMRARLRNQEMAAYCGCKASCCCSNNCGCTAGPFLQKDVGSYSSLLSYASPQSPYASAEVQRQWSDVMRRKFVAPKPQQRGPHFHSLVTITLFLQGLFSHLPQLQWQDQVASLELSISWLSLVNFSPCAGGHLFATGTRLLELLTDVTSLYWPQFEAVVARIWCTVAEVSPENVPRIVYYLLSTTFVTSSGDIKSMDVPPVTPSKNFVPSVRLPDCELSTPLHVAKAIMSCLSRSQFKVTVETLCSSVGPMSKDRGATVTSYCNPCNCYGCFQSRREAQCVYRTKCFQNGGASDAAADETADASDGFESDEEYTTANVIFENVTDSVQCGDESFETSENPELGVGSSQALAKMHAVDCLLTPSPPRHKVAAEIDKRALWARGPPSSSDNSESSDSDNPFDRMVNRRMKDVDAYSDPDGTNSENEEEDCYGAEVKTEGDECNTNDPLSLNPTGPLPPFNPFTAVGLVLLADALCTPGDMMAPNGPKSPGLFQSLFQQLPLLLHSSVFCLLSPVSIFSVNCIAAEPTCGLQQSRQPQQLNFDKTEEQGTDEIVVAPCVRQHCAMLLANLLKLVALSRPNKLNEFGVTHSAAHSTEEKERSTFEVEGPVLQDLGERARTSRRRSLSSRHLNAQTPPPLQRQRAASCHSQNHVTQSQLSPSTSEAVRRLLIQLYAVAAPAAPDSQAQSSTDQTNIFIVGQILEAFTLALQEGWLVGEEVDLHAQWQRTAQQWTAVCCEHFNSMRAPGNLGGYQPPVVSCCPRGGGGAVSDALPKLRQLPLSVSERFYSAGL